MKLDKGSRISYHRQLGKYRIYMNGSVYTTKGKFLFDTDYNTYQQKKSLAASIIDRWVEFELKDRNLPIPL
jgi:hypothetical protein